VICGVLATFLGKATEPFGQDFYIKRKRGRREKIGRVYQLVQKVTMLFKEKRKSAMQ